MDLEILKALRDDRKTLSEVLRYMYIGEKINAIKNLRYAGLSRDCKCTFGLKEAKDFIDGYYDSPSQLNNDVLTLSSKKGKKKSQEYQFQGVDLRQVDTASLKALSKSLRKELKKRGIKY